MPAMPPQSSPSCAVILPLEELVPAELWAPPVSEDGVQAARRHPRLIVARRVERIEEYGREKEGKETVHQIYGTNCDLLRTKSCKLYDKSQFILNTFFIQKPCYALPMAETIFTKHPQKGRSGKEISKQKYEAIRIALTEVLTLVSPLNEQEVTRVVEERLQKTPFPGDIGWYVHTVLLDLEARGVVQKVKEGKRVEYRLWPELPI
jgi:hypothetical protein